ncbi:MULTISPECIES: response regulator [Cupriavidus]
MTQYQPVSRPALLVVDDDPEIRDLLSRFLAEAGYCVATARDGEEMWRSIRLSPPDVVVLDLMLPGEDGLSLCRALHGRSDIRVIMLTSRGTLLDRIVGLELGADDYLPKPFDPRELLARIKAVLRRRDQSGAHGSPAAAGSPPFLHFAGWRLDTIARQLLSPQGKVVTLGGSDYRALKALLDHPRRPLSRDFLLDHVFGRSGAANDRAIDVCISRLRQHLEVRPRDAEVIRTVRNEGYMLTAEVTPAHA